MRQSAVPPRQSRAPWRSIGTAPARARQAKHNVLCGRRHRPAGGGGKDTRAAARRSRRTACWHQRQDAALRAARRGVATTSARLLARILHRRPLALVGTSRRRPLRAPAFRREQLRAGDRVPRVMGPCRLREELSGAPPATQAADPTASRGPTRCQRALWHQGRRLHRTRPHVAGDSGQGRCVVGWMASDQCNRCPHACAERRGPASSGW